MKIFWELLPPAVKAVATVVVFFISLGWASYGAVILIVKAEGQEIKKQVMEVRSIDMTHIDRRFDRIEQLIRERR